MKRFSTVCAVGGHRETEKGARTHSFFDSFNRSCVVEQNLREKKAIPAAQPLCLAHKVDVASTWKNA
jgi:hypothetical protein